MATLRCSLCGINYPYRNEFLSCPIHEEEETKILRDSDPDKDWDERAKALKIRLLEEDLRPYPKVEGVELHEDEGLQWVYHAELLRAGFRPSVLAGGEFRLFELNGDVFELQGWDEKNRRWWIEYVAPSPAVISVPGG